MGYKDLIKLVADYSGISESDSKDVLDLVVESLAVRLSEPERIEFAKKLPEQLSDIALAVYPSRENSEPDIIEQFMGYQKVGKIKARYLIKAAWKALKDALPGGEITRVRSGLPSRYARLLS